MEDRFYKSNKNNLEENIVEGSENDTGEKEIELFEINENANKNNNKDETDATNMPSNKKKDSPLLDSAKNPTLDFSGTMNYI